MTHFSISNSIPIYWLYILIDCIRICSFSLFAILISSLGGLFIYLFTLVLLFVNLHLSEHLLSMQLSDIIAMTNSRNDSESLWKIPHWIFTLVTVCYPGVNSNCSSPERMSYISCAILAGFFFPEIVRNIQTNK